MADSDLARARLMQLLEGDEEELRKAVVEKTRFVADRLSSPPLAVAEHLRIIAQRKPQV